VIYTICIMKALVVEDHALIRMSTLRVLETEEYEVKGTGSGEDAIALLAEDSCFDAILMDIDLGPGRMDGIAAAAEIDHRWGIPVVFYSGHVDRETIDRTRNVTRYGYVQKSPGHERYLVASLEMAVRLRTAERERERAGRRLQAIFDAADDNILIHRIDDNGLPGRYVAVNQSTCETLGYTREELLSMSPLDTSVGDEGDDEASAKIMAGLLRNGRARFEMAGRRRDGSTVPFEIRAQIIEEDGERLVVGVSRDMTEYHRTRTAMRQTNELYRIVTENVTETVAVYDAAMNVRYISPTSAGQSGWSPEELAGTDVFSLVHPEDAPRLQREITDARSQGLGEYTNRYRCRSKDGTFAWMESTTRLIRDESGVVEAVVVASRCIDELMALTRELERLRELVPADESARAGL
jgi:PAS domain S-box-containing protein